MGPNCGFYTAGHSFNYVERNEGLEYVKPIIVGDNVWFGGNVVVGAGSVVTKDISVV